MELFDSKRRAIAGISLEFQWIFCYLTLPILAYYIADWRTLQIIMSLSSAIWIIYIWYASVNNFNYLNILIWIWNITEDSLGSFLSERVVLQGLEGSLPRVPSLVRPCISSVYLVHAFITVKPFTLVWSRDIVSPHKSIRGDE